jgi:hypothetical protein
VRLSASLKGAVAAFAAAASFAAVGVAPASANHIVLPVDPEDVIAGAIAEPVWPDCIHDPSVPTCVNYAIDVAENTVDGVEGAYERHVKPWACDVQWILDGQGCA